MSEETAAAAAPQKKKMSAAERRKRAKRLHTGVRLGVQILFFVLAPGLFSSAFNGVKYVCTQVGAMQAIAPTSFVVVLVGALAYTILFGRFFCGYACAFGTMGDVLFLLATPLRAKLRIPSIDQLPWLAKGLQLLKYVVLLAICVMCFTGFWTEVSGKSPWTAFASITGGTFNGLSRWGVGLLALIVVGQALLERSFCRFLCPMGAVFALMPVLPFSQFSRNAGRCGKRCNKCQEACPVHLHPEGGSLSAGDCIACGRCAEACPLGNVNLLCVEKPSEEKRPVPLVKLKGSGIGWVLGKAAVLLILCWLLGLMRFAPAAVDVLPFALPWA